MTAIRGATTVSVNAAEEIANAAAELIDEIMNRNFLDGEDIVAIIFSCTKDLTAAYPAKGAREMSSEPLTSAYGLWFCAKRQ